MYFDCNSDARSGVPPYESTCSRAVLIREYRPCLLRSAWRITKCREDAEDIVQEAFLRWLAQPKIADDRAWLLKVVYHLAIDCLRKRHSKPLGEEYLLDESQWRDDDTRSRLSAPDENIDLVWACGQLFATLSPLERTTFVMRDVLEMTYGEIGNRIRRNASACRQLVHRARTRLLLSEPDDATMHPPRWVAAFAVALAGLNVQIVMRLLLSDIAS